MKAEYLLNYDVISQAGENTLFVMARITGKPNPEENTRRTLNLSVVLDRSGSMGGNKIAYVKRAAQFLVGHLSATDTFSLVSYDNNVKVEVTPTSPTRKDMINQVIEALRPGGSTNLSGGWLKGTGLVEENQVEGGVNRVLLLTDGLANQGITEPRRLIGMARQKSAEGITTTTMGVGMDFNEDLLKEMASEGGGAFYFIDNPDQAPAIFREELRDLLSVVGQNLNITLTLSSFVTLVRQWHVYPMTESKDSVEFRMGDIFADEEKSVLIELSIPSLNDLGEVEVARLRFEYDELEEEQVHHRVLEIPVMVNVAEADHEKLKAPPNEEVQKSVLLLRAARARDTAVEHADRGDFEEASKVLKSVADLIDASGIEDQDLREEHDQLRESAVDMELGAERYDSHARKMHTTSSVMATRAGHFADMKASAFRRMKQSRTAIERGDDTPGVIAWGKESFQLQADIITIGRSRENDIVIDDIEISKRHCQIIKSGDNYLLEDLNSKNGTFANGGIVTGKFRLSVGDVMTLGNTLFTFKK